ncbi:MAG: hypothetical protein JWP65_1867 [Ramlibacter sp.]|uniref:hypothetical protein n=1 Tax=Ramlibacter sp. TaxID=1917967 RepID=UPI0026069D3D|nr:hypothetical protein [Ramlibacter sp.]MDB5751446.1 hypothetical protein [Ramlibacter sp.]
MVRISKVAVRVACLALLTFSNAYAFQILPKISDVDRKLSSLSADNDWLGQWFVDGVLSMLKSPVHEAITLAAVECDAGAGNEPDCVTIDSVKKHRTLLYGVRWPDDPPFQLSASNPPRKVKCDVRVTLRSTAQPQCWKGLFDDAGKRAAEISNRSPGKPAFGPGDYLLYRSHYGDLQFMHAMGAYDGEPAGVTRQRMKMWARFLWGVAIKELPTDHYLRDLGVDELATYFPGDMTATNLLATGIVEVRKNLDVVALGAMLHMIQDSYSQAHAERAAEPGGVCPGTDVGRPGKIIRFHSYARQRGELHDYEDTFDALRLHSMQSSPSVVETSRSLVALARRSATWTDAEKVFDCLLELTNPDEPAQAGRFAGP